MRAWRCKWNNGLYTIMTELSKISTALMCSLATILCRFYCIFEQWGEKMRGVMDFIYRQAKRRAMKGLGNSILLYNGDRKARIA